MGFKKGHKPTGGKKFSKDYQPPKENVGRPPSVIDEKKLEQMAADDYTVEEMAAELDVSHETIYARFSDKLKKGRLKGNGSLKRRLREKAMAGDTSLLIWLSKVRLGYREPKDETTYNTYNVTVNEVPE